MAFFHFWAMNNHQVINLIGLTIGFVSFYYEQLTPFWGVVFLFWVYKGLKEGNISLFFYTDKKEHPVIYWLLVILWIVIALYFLFYPLLV